MDHEIMHIIPHSHWDREWYMGFERHRMRLVELFDTLIDVMEKNPDYTYYHMDGQFVTVEDYLEVRPGMKDRLMALIRADRIQIGPWYILQDEYLTCGESNVRNMLYGIKLCRSVGADPVMTGYFPDAFGNISQAPQILKQFGIDNAAFGRGVSEVGFDNAIAEKPNPSEWRWSSPDGSEVIGVMFSHWYCNAMELPAERQALKEKMLDMVEKCRECAYTPHLLGMNGCDHQPVQTNLPEVIDMANDILKDQNITVRQSNFKDYLNCIRPYVGGFPEFQGELNGQGTNGVGLLINTASTHIPLKQRNWHCENLLTRQAEPISVLAARAGDSYREDMLLFAWKKLMQNHPHDSICSCSSDEVTDEMVSRFDHAQQVGEFIRDESLDYLCKHVAADRKSVLVFHGTAGTSTELVTTYVDYPLETSLEGICLVSPDGSVVPAIVKDLGKTFTYTLPKDTFRKVKYVNRYEITFPATLTGIGYCLYTVQETAAPKAEKITVRENGAETATMALTIAANGTLTVTDKKSGVTYEGMNYFEDEADIGESYNFIPMEGDAHINTLSDTARVWIERRNDVTVTFGIENHWALPVGRDGGKRSAETVDTVMTSLVTLTAGIDRVDVTTTFNNQSEDHRVRVMFTPHIASDVVLADGQFDLVERPVQPWKQWTNPSYCQRHQSFFAMENEKSGFAVAGKGLHEYEVLRDGSYTMALTLLRCIGEMGDWGIFPTPKMQLKGVHTLEYSLIPYAAADRAAAHALARSFAADAMMAHEVDAQEGTMPAAQMFATVDRAELVTSACKRSEDRRYTVLRLYNPLPTAVEAELTVNTALVEEVYASTLAEVVGERLPMNDGKVKLSVPAKKIVTYLLR